MKHPFNAGHHIIVVDELAAIQLLKPLVHFSPEPLVVVDIGLYDFLHKLLGPAPWVAALAVGLAMIAMHLTDTFHPPAGIDPLVIVVNDLTWGFLIAPVGAGALLLALFAYVWHNVVARGPNKGDIWPTRWW